MALVSDYYTVEMQIGVFFGTPQWVDMSPYLEPSEGLLSITRGRADEQSQPVVGKLSVGLNNSDGRFTPYNTGSPYWPFVVDGAPIRVTARVPTTVNLIDNPSMEFGTAKWVGGGSVPPAVDPSTTHVYPDGGQWALLITWGTGGSFPAAIRVMFGLTIGMQYTASAWIYSPTGSPNVGLVIGGGVGGAASSTHDVFTRVTVTFTATATSHQLQVWPATAPTAGQQCWVDALQLETGASASTYNPAGAVRSDRFYGTALEWPTGWRGPQATYAVSQLVAVDLTSWLGSRSGRLRPFDVEEALFDNPLTYLPLDEPAGATQAGNLGSVTGQGQFVNPGGGGTFTFGTGTGPPADGTSSLVLSRASASSGWFVRAPTNLSTAAMTVEAFINTTTADTTIVNVAVAIPGDPFVGYGMELRVSAAGKLEWRSDGSLTVASAASITDGATHHVAATYVHTGTQHTAALFIDGAAAGTSSVSATWINVFAYAVLVGGGQKLNLFNGTINHVGVYATALSVDRLNAHYHAGWDGFGGERSDVRISRLAAYGGLASLTPSSVTGVWVLDNAINSVLGTSTILAAGQLNLEVGQSYVYGQSTGGDDVITAMQNVAATEGGLVLADRAGFLQFQTRNHRYNRTPKVSLPAEYATADLAPSFDDQGLANDVTVTTQDGAVTRYVDAASVAQRGTYDPGPVSSLSRDLLDAASAASWKVTRHTAPQLKYPNVTVDLLTIPTDVAAAVLSVDVGDRLDVTALPSQVPSSAQLFAEGYTETVGPDICQIAFNTTSAAGYQVWVLANPSFSVLDSATILAW